MSEETKRLLKYDLRCTVKNIWVLVLIVTGLWLWCYLIYDTVANAALLISFVAGMLFLNMGVMDWQVQIRMYVSAGMSRKGIFQVLNIRNAIIFLAGLLIESVIAGVAYPVFRTKFLIISGAFLLLIWGFGQIAGVLAYHRKKLGQVLIIIGYILVMIPCMGSFSLGEEASVFWSILFENISWAYILVMGVASITVLAGGICFARKHMREYMVY